MSASADIVKFASAEKSQAGTSHNMQPSTAVLALHQMANSVPIICMALLGLSGGHCSSWVAFTIAKHSGQNFPKQTCQGSDDEMRKQFQNVQ